MAFCFRVTACTWLGLSYVVLQCRLRPTLVLFKNCKHVRSILVPYIVSSSSVARCTSDASNSRKPFVRETRVRVISCACHIICAWRAAGGVSIQERVFRFSWSVGATSSHNNSTFWCSTFFVVEASYWKQATCYKTSSRDACVYRVCGVVFVVHGGPRTRARFKSEFSISHDGVLMRCRLLTIIRLFGVSTFWCSIVV